MITKYIGISDDMFINLLNVAVETVDEYSLFVLEKAIRLRFFDEAILLEPEVQRQFVEIIRDRMDSKDKYYIYEKYKEYKINSYIEKGTIRQENCEVNETSAIKFFIEKLESFVLLKNAQEIMTAIKNADQNISLGLLQPEDLIILKDKLFSLLDNITFSDDFGEMELTDIKGRELDRTLNCKTKMIPTHIPSLNNILRGGAFPNRLYFIAAPPGFGKSMFLTNLGHQALMENKVVYHISLEMPAPDVMIRYDSLISGRSVNDIENSPIELVEQNIKKFKEKYPDSYLVIKFWEPLSLTKEALVLYLKRKIMTSGKRPDMIIVDYADIMRSSKKSRERREELGTIYTQLKALATEFKCPVWTASQINREGFKKVETDMSNLSDSWDKAMIADLVLVVRQSPEELKNNKMRLYVAKFRSGASRRADILCNVNYPYMTIRECEDLGFKDISEINFGGEFLTKEVGETETPEDISIGEEIENLFNS